MIREVKSMAKRTNLKKGDKILICGEEYQLIKNLYALKGFQFRTWLVKGVSNKKYVAKITEDPNKALNELRTYIYLKTKSYPERYYAEMIAFDHKALLVRSNDMQFYILLLRYLPEEKFLSLDEYLKKNPAKKQKERLANKLKRRVGKLHELGISHGDIREANIMVKETKRGIGIRLIDFGLSKFGDQKAIRKDDKRVESLIRKLKNVNIG
jgi:tRNA A-37 threonylcarbamoyl transferase component Bud32